MGKGKARRKPREAAPVPERVRLSRGLTGTASFLEIGRGGALVIELYDFSEAAHDALGSDVAFTVTVGPQAKDRLLLTLLRERFEDYYEAKRWLEERDIPFVTGFEPWA